MLENPNQKIGTQLIQHTHTKNRYIQTLDYECQTPSNHAKLKRNSLHKNHWSFSQIGLTLMLIWISLATLCQGQNEYGVDLDVSDQNINANAFYTFTLTVTNSKIDSGLYVKITVPVEIQISTTSGSNMPTCYETVLQAGSPPTTVTKTIACKYTVDTLNMINYISYTTTTAYSNVYTYGITVGPITNPGSAYQWYQITSFMLETSGANPTDSISTGIASDYFPGSIYAQTLTQSVTNAKAGGTDTYTFKFKISNPITRKGFLYVTFPSAWSGVPAGLKDITTVSLYGTSTGTVTTATSSSTQIAVFDNLFQSSGLAVQSSNYITVTFTGITDPTIIGTTGSFGLATYDNAGIMIDYITTGLKISVTQAGDIVLNTFTPYTTTVDTQTVLLFKITPSVMYASGGYIEIVGPSGYIRTSTPVVCGGPIGFVGGTTTQCNQLTSYSIKLQRDISSGSSYLQFTVNSFINPLGAVTLPSYALYLKNSDGSTVSQVTTGMTYTTTAGSCSVSSLSRSASLVVGATNAVYTINFSCSHRITNTGRIVMTFPLDQVVYQSGITCMDGLLNTAIGCSATQITGGLLQVVATQWCSTTSSDCPTNVALSLKLINVKNPGYIVPTPTSSVTIQAQNQISSQWLVVDQILTGVVFPQNLVPGTITPLGVARGSNLLTGAVTSFTFTFKIVTPITTGGYAVITFPDQTAFQNQPTPGLSCTSSPGSSTCTSTGSSADSTIVLTVSWTAICSSGCTAGTSFTLSVTNVYNPFSTASNSLISYTVNTYTSLGYQIDTGTQIFAQPTLLPNALTASLTSPTSPITVGAVATYTIEIKNPINRLPSSTNGGSLVITLPLEALLTSSTCSATTSSITLTCTASTSTQKITVTSPSDLPKASIITVTMPNSVRNPQTGAPSPVFVMNTYYNTASIDTYSALTITCDTPNQIISALSERSQSAINDQATFTISFYTTNPIPIGAIVYFSMPNDQAVLTTSGSTTILAEYTQSLIAKTSTRNINPSGSYITFNMPEWCSGDNAGTQCPATTYKSSVAFKGFSNPPTATAPTLSVVISTKTYDGFIIDSISVGLFTTPYVNYGPLQSVSISRSSDVVGASTTLTLILMTNSNIKSELTGYAVTVFLSLPVDFLYKSSASTTCTSQIAGGTLTSPSCSPTIAAVDPQKMGNYVQSIKFSLPCSTASSCSPGSTFSVTVSGLVNPYNTKSNTGTLTTATQSQLTSGSSVSVINSFDSIIGTTTGALLGPYKTNVITVNSVTRSITTVGAATIILFDLVLTNRLQKNGYVQVVISTEQFVPNGAAYTYQVYFSGSYGSTITITPTSVTLSYVTFQIKEWCNGGANYCPDGYNMKFKILTGFNNLGYVSSPTSFISITTMTSDLLGQTDQVTNVQATPALTAAVLTINSITLSSTKVATIGVNADISVKFGASITTGTLIILSFSTEFLRIDQASMTCADYTSGTAVAMICTPYSTLGILNSVQISSMCTTTCTSTGTYIIRLVNVNNILSQFAFSGTLTVQTFHTLTQMISQGSYTLSSVATLTPGILLSTAVTRSQTTQGKPATFTLTWTTPGILLSQSVVELNFPLNQIIILPSASAYIIKDTSAGTTLTYSTMSGSPTATYNNLQISQQWKCATTSTHCLPPLVFQITITQAENPYISSTTYNDFVIKMYTISTNQAIFQSTSPLVALPDLTFGIITNIVISMFASVYVSTTPTYTISFTTGSDTPKNGKFVIRFPTGRAVQYSSTSVSCKSGTTPYTCTSSWSTGALVLSVNNYCSSAACLAGDYSFTFSGNMINPSTVPTADTNFIIDSTDSSGNIINEGKILNSLVTPILPGSMTTASVVRASTSLSADTQYTVSFTTVNAVPSNGYFRIIIALDQIQVPATGPPTCQMAFVLTVISCPMIYKTTSFETIDMPQTCGSSGCAAGTPVSIILSDVSNPSVFSANYVTSTWSVYTMTSTKALIDGKYSGLQATPPLVGRTVLILTVEMDSYIVNTKTDFRIVFIPGASFTKAALFDVYFPDGFATGSSASNTCTLLDVADTDMQCSYTYYSSGYIQKVILTNPCPNQCSSTASYTYQIPLITRGDVYPVGGSFTVITRYQYVDVGMGLLSNALTLIPAKITQYSVFNQNCDAVDQICPLYVTFKLINNVQKSSGRGQVTIQIPSDITIKSTSCSATIDNSQSSCSCSISSSIVTVTHSISNTVAGYNFTVRLLSIKNPSSTAPTSSLIIQSAWDVLNNKVYYAIDQVSSGVIYQVHICSALTNLAVKRDAGNLNVGYMTGQPTSLFITFKLVHTLVATSAFQITLPTAAEVMLNPLASTMTCYQTDAGGNSLNLILCTLLSSNNTILVRNYCQVGNCGSTDTVYFKMFDDFIQNYYYILTPVNILTQNVTLRTTTANGYFFIDQGSVIPTPSLQPTPLIMPSPEVIRTSNIIGQKVYWVINFKINKNPVPNGGYIIINVPQGVLIPIANAGLDVMNYDTGLLYSNYTYSTYSDGSISTIQVNNFCNSSQPCNIGSSFSVKIDWIKNPMAQLNVAIAINVQTRTKEGYQVELGTTAKVNSLFSQLIPVTLENVFLRPVDPTVGVTTRYEISFSSDADFSYSDVLALTFPNETSVLTTTVTSRILATATNSTTRCKSVLDPSLNITCAVISTNLVYVYGLFKHNDKTYTVSVDNILNPVTALTTSNMIITAQSYKGLLIAQLSTGTNIVIQPVIVQSTCNKVCGTCSGTNSTCASCVVPSQYPLFKQFQCTDECGDGYFLHHLTPANNSDNLPQCLQCHQSCQTCYGAGYDKCIACSSGYYMENGLCVQWCSKGITKDSTLNQCVNPNTKNCSSNCLTCSTNTSSCLSCNKQSQYPVYDPTQGGTCIMNDQAKCNSSVSERFYIDSSSQKCSICQSLCRQCSLKSDECTSCWSADFFTNIVINELYQTCVERCGLGTWFNKPINTCSFCNPVSLLCSGYDANQCVACNKTPEGQQLFLLDTSCVIECPAKYTANSFSNTCDKGNASILSFSFIFMFACIVIGVLILLSSYLIARRKDKSLDILYAITSMVEFLNRICILGNLWIHSSVFSLAICFMNLIATCAIGVFFNFLYMIPIYEHSPHFRRVFKSNWCTYQTMTAISYFAGMNVMRLLCSGLYGLIQFKSDLNNYKFYLAPLNIMANFTIIFTVFQMGLCVFVLLTYTISDDAFILAIFGVFMNMIMIILQLFKHLNTKAFMAKNQ